MSLEAGATIRAPRGPYQKSEATRQAILDAGLSVFAQTGYRSGSLRDVADQVSMSQAGILHHFPTKSALLAAVLEHRDALSYALVDFEHAEPLTALQGLVELARRSSDSPGVVELYCIVSAEATAPDHPAHTFFTERYARLRWLIESILRRLATQGALRPEVDPARAALGILAVWDGLQVQWLLDRRALDIPTELHRHLQDLLTVPLSAPA